MYIPFDEIDFDARIWIYQAGRDLTEAETATLRESLKAALEGWEAHGKPLVASEKIFYRRFIVIAVDEAKESPSGCAIDKSTHWLQELGSRMQINFFDRSVAWLDSENKVHSVPINEVKEKIEAGEIEDSTTVFDNLVQTKAQWMSRWKVRADATWLKRYLDQIPG